MFDFSFFFLALQENDHMTKVEVFHCAVCEAFISPSSSSVRAHVVSQEHLANIKVGLAIYQFTSALCVSRAPGSQIPIVCDFVQRFDALQRRVCLDRAQAMMEELKPQFQHFLKVFKQMTYFIEP